MNFNLKTFTVRIPSNRNVGSGPIENINLNIVAATKVRIPDSLGSVTTIKADNNITAQMSSDKCEPKSKKKHCKNHTQKISYQQLF